MTEPEDYGCDRCSRLAPLLEVSDGRCLCLTCIERDPEHGGVDPEAIDTLRLLSSLSPKPD